MKFSNLPSAAFVLTTNVSGPLRNSSVKATARPSSLPSYGQSDGRGLIRRTEYCSGEIDVAGHWIAKAIELACNDCGRTPIEVAVVHPHRKKFVDRRCDNSAVLDNSIVRRVVFDSRAPETWGRGHCAVLPAIQTGLLGANAILDGIRYNGSVTAARAEMPEVRLERNRLK
jgi:hypothetical protein